ncbi:hypothetical protein O3P69_020176 [Scylla paramamosain]|uniref:Uncharacterized protein n=1 Tax=Scylla paramamosain TaxID=85552 RepID=A0AAW0TK47_SCYPA
MEGRCSVRIVLLSCNSTTSFVRRDEGDANDAEATDADDAEATWLKLTLTKNRRRSEVDADDAEATDGTEHLEENWWTMSDDEG